MDVSTISEAVFARSVSSAVPLRTVGQHVLAGPEHTITVEDRQTFLTDVRDALWSAKVVAYAQGLDEIRTAAAEYNWEVDMGQIASIWRDGCIIRARLLQRIRDEYAAGDLVSLLEAPSVKAELARCQQAWRRVVACAVRPVFQFRDSLQPWATTTKSEPLVLTPLSPRVCATFSVPTRTGALTTKVLGTSTGQATVAKSAPTESSLHESGQPWPSCLFLPHATP